MQTTDMLPLEPATSISGGRNPKLSIRVFLVPNEPGFDAIAADLPGTVSYGESEAQALENIREAVLMTIAECRQRGVAVAWRWMGRPEGGCSEHRVFIND